MRELKINGIYRHFKGDYYIVIRYAEYKVKQKRNMLYIEDYMEIMSFILDHMICF